MVTLIAYGRAGRFLRPAVVRASGVAATVVDQMLHTPLTTNVVLTFCRKSTYGF